MSVLYRQRVVEGLQKKIENGPGKENIRLQMGEKEEVLHPMHTRYVTRLECRVYQNGFRAFADWI